MTDKHTLTLDHQVKQSQTVKRLTAKCSRYRAGLERARDALLRIWPTGAKSEHANARAAFEEIEKALNTEGEK